LKRKEKQLNEALEAVKKASELEPDCAPSLVLKADILQKSGKDFATQEFLAMAEKTFPSIEEQSSWELHWFGVMAMLKGDKDLQDEIARHRKSNPKQEPSSAIPENAVFPICAELK